MKITCFQQNSATSEGAVSHNVLYYQQLSFAGLQIIFDAKKKIFQVTTNTVQCLKGVYKHVDNGLHFFAAARKGYTCMSAACIDYQAITRHVYSCCLVYMLLVGSQARP